MNKFLLLLLFVCLEQATLRAQFIDTTTTNPYSSPYELQFQGKGSLITGVLVAKGNYGSGTLQSSEAGAGTRLLWYPNKAAFRAGRIDSSTNPYSGTLTGVEWDDTNIGAYSVALGYNTVASGPGTSAFGKFTLASGNYSIAAGYSSVATGVYAVALGNSVSATGDEAVALGYGSTAMGWTSTALGRSTLALGSYSTTMGNSSQAYAYASVAIGRYNLGSDICSHASGGDTASMTNWYSADPLLEVGNGSSATPSNAFTVYKNGTATVQGMVTAPTFMTTANPAAGDIPMFGH